MKVYLIPILIVIVFLFIAISGCKKHDEKVTESIKVAMLAQGNSFDDMSFLQSCKEGMENAKTDFNLSVDYNIDTATNNYKQRIEEYGEQGYDLIIVIGFMWNDAVVAAAKKYSDTKFVYVDAELSESQGNAVSVLFDVDEAAFPLGFLSAWWADSHDNTDPTLGFVGAMVIPQIMQFIDPFENGMVRYNQQYGTNVDIIGGYTNNFFNEGLGKQFADSLINEGADVIFGVGSEAGNGALLKAHESGVVGVGVDVDQYYSFPEVSDILLSSAMKGLNNAIYAVVKLFVENNFIGGGIYTGNLANEGVDIAPFHDFDNQIPDSIKTEIEAIKQGIIDGSISTGW